MLTRSKEQCVNRVVTVRAGESLSNSRSNCRRTVALTGSTHQTLGPDVTGPQVSALSLEGKNVAIT
eukprot:3048389-Rhodomonas_salina.1